MHSLRSRVILLLDDDLSGAHRIVKWLRLRQASVLGPVPTIEFALEIIQTERRIDYALLNRTLRSATTFGVADELMRRHVPFMFLNGEQDDDLPVEYGHIHVRSKPLAVPELAEILKASFAPSRPHATSSMRSLQQST